MFGENVSIFMKRETLQKRHKHSNKHERMSQVSCVLFLTPTFKLAITILKNLIVLKLQTY